jgi:hypothetical protein
MSSLRKLKKRSFYALGFIVSLVFSYFVKDNSSDPVEVSRDLSFPHAHADFSSGSASGSDGDGGDDMEGSTGGSSADGSCSGSDGCDGGDAGDGCDSGDGF